MGLETFVMILAIVIVGMAWYANTSKRNKIKCTFRRINKTKLTKYVRMQSRYVIFDGGKYDIIPSRITFEWDRSGIAGWLFPQFVPTLDYSYNSRFPHDPNNMNKNWETPEVRKAINKEEWVKSYAKGFTPPSQKKQSMINQWLPWVAIALVVIIGFYLYTNMQGLGQEVAIIHNDLNAITK